MREIQKKIEKFNEEREWQGIYQLKDLMLNMNEEIGEMWHIIKWIDEKKQAEMIEKNKEEVGNFIGDMQYLVLKIASICNVDAEAETLKVMEEYEKRFPIEAVKKYKHGNTKAGGIDYK